MLKIHTCTDSFWTEDLKMDYASNSLTIIIVA
nr:MAG TPA_asm: hypothetical protein [Caudoviricetes sp.]